jgi:hypothetical protein
MMDTENEITDEELEDLMEELAAEDYINEELEEEDEEA